MDLLITTSVLKENLSILSKVQKLQSTPSKHFAGGETAFLTAKASRYGRVQNLCIMCVRRIWNHVLSGV